MKKRAITNANVKVAVIMNETGVEKVFVGPTSADRAQEYLLNAPYGYYDILEYNNIEIC
jgi:hypothetical protein